MSASNGLAFEFAATSNSSILQIDKTLKRL